VKQTEILKYYWLSSPQLPAHVTTALEKGVSFALRGREKRIDGGILESVRAQGFDANPRMRILQSRKFEDDIRLIAGNDEVSIEIENDGNRLEFDILKMMSFGETVATDRRAFGCLIIPAKKELKNPYISGSGKERIWDYVTNRLLPMILPIKGLRLENILVLGYERPNDLEVSVQVPSRGTRQSERSLRGLVHEEWINAGQPLWDIDRTLKAAIEADTYLEQNGLGNPAEEFRASRKVNQLPYMRLWVRGCKFNWLKKT
jgi:hypothetical protein